MIETEEIFCFGNNGFNLWKNGWSIFPQELNRIPSKINNEIIEWKKTYHLDEKQATENDIQKWINDAKNANIAVVLGKGSSNLFAIDVDVTNKEVSEHILKIAIKIMGVNPFIRIGESPKFALFYRSPEIDQILTKVYSLSGSNKNDILEIKSHGTCITILGEHPKTHNQYMWAKDITQESIKNVPLVKAEQVQDFINEVNKFYPFINSQKKLLDIDGRERNLRDIVFHHVKTKPNLEVEVLTSLIEKDFLEHNQMSGRWNQSFLKKQIKQKIAYTLRNIKIDLKEQDDNDFIFVNQYDLNDAVYKSIEFLKSKQDFFVMGHEIKKVVLIKIGSNYVPKIYSVTESDIKQELMKTTYKKVDKNGNFVRISPSNDIVKMIISMGSNTGLKNLSGVTQTPIMRKDGTFHHEDGYDDETGYYYSSTCDILPVIHKEKKDALEALNNLKYLISGFPFKTLSDRSVALSAIISSTLRTSLDNCPAHGFSAYARGSGKSSLVDIASIISTGFSSSIISQSSDEEMRKHIGTKLLSGSNFLNIDNCTKPVGGDFLCSILTQPFVSVRVLGSSVAHDISTKTMICATGNNLTFLGDMNRRAILCNLDADVERPELRNFQFNPIEKAKEYRNVYLHNVMTIIASYIHHKKPISSYPLGSYENWSQIVRNALIWLGEDDPCKTMDDMQCKDPEIEIFENISETCYITFQDRSLTANEIVSIAEELFIEKNDTHLFNALQNICGNTNNNRLNSIKLGKWIKFNLGRIVNNYKWTDDGYNRYKTKIWKLIKIEKENE